MGSLSNLYISQSYKSLAHLGTDNALVSGQMTLLQDGIGQSLNISFDGTNISSSGNIYAANITASVVNTGSFVSTSSFNSYTQSTNVRLNNLETTSASVNVSITNLNASSASQQVSINNLNAATGSYVTETESGSFLITASAVSNVLTFTKGNNTQFSVTVGTDINTGSYVTTSSFNAYTQSTNVRLNNLESTTASLNSSITQLNASSASQQISINALNTFTASVSTASIVTSISNLNSFTASQITQNTTLGQVTSSILNFTASTNVSIANINNATASLQTQLTTIGGQSGSWITESETGSFLTTASFNAYTQSNNQRVSSLESNSASVNVSISNINTTTASLNTSISNLNSFSSSQLTQNSALATVTSSLIISASTAKSTNDAQDISIANLNTFTSSANVRLNNLELTSASVNTSITNLNASSASQQVSINAINAITNSFVTETESGSFLLTASFDNGTRNLTFTKGNNTTFAVNIPDVSGSTINTGSFVTTSSFNSYTSSNDQRVSSLESNSASVNISISNLNTATASLNTSASLALITASISGNTLTFTKGNNTTFNILIPTATGSIFNTSSFITTGSAGLIQTISGSLIVNTTLIASQSVTDVSPGGSPTLEIDYSQVGDLINYWANLGFVGVVVNGPSMTNVTISGFNYSSNFQIYLNTSTNTIPGQTYTLSGPYYGVLRVTGSILSDTEFRATATDNRRAIMDVNGFYATNPDSSIQAGASVDGGVYTGDNLNNNYIFLAATSSQVRDGVGNPTPYDTLQIAVNQNNNGAQTQITFQGNNNYTDGRITSHQPFEVSSSMDFYAHGHKQFNVGAFQSNITQSGSANVSQSMKFETTDISNGVTIASNSRITLANAGTYNIQFSAQIDRISGSGTDTVYIWLKKNGVNVSASAGAVTITGGALAAKAIAAWNYVVNAAANDYYELAWQTTDTNIQLINVNASGNVPGIPSIILTVTQVR